MKVKQMGKFIKLITFGWPAAITLAPFGIYIDERYIKDESIIRHESVHWKQQTEMLYIFFYLWYLIEWIIKLFIYGKKAYYNISFEREARLAEDNITYIHYRKHYYWVKFL